MFCKQKICIYIVIAMLLRPQSHHNFTFTIITMQMIMMMMVIMSMLSLLLAFILWATNWYCMQHAMRQTHFFFASTRHYIMLLQTSQWPYFLFGFLYFRTTGICSLVLLGVIVNAVVKRQGMRFPFFAVFFLITLLL